MIRERRAITYLLAFLAVYLLITGTLVLIFRGLILDERAAEGEEIASRIPLLEQQVRERERQEQEIVRELISVSGATDYEGAYASIQAEISSLEQQRETIIDEITDARQLRLGAERSRDDAYARVQAFELEQLRLEANLASCRSQLSSCINSSC